MSDPRPNAPGGGWEEGRATASLPDPRSDDVVKEPPNEPVPAEGDYGSLDEPEKAPVQPLFEPAF